MIHVILTIILIIILFKLKLNIKEYFLCEGRLDAKLNPIQKDKPFLLSDNDGNYIRIKSNHELLSRVQIELLKNQNNQMILQLPPIGERKIQYIFSKNKNNTFTLIPISSPSQTKPILTNDWNSLLDASNLPIGIQSNQTIFLKNKFDYPFGIITPDSILYFNTPLPVKIQTGNQNILEFILQIPNHQENTLVPFPQKNQYQLLPNFIDNTIPNDSAPFQPSQYIIPPIQKMDTLFVPPPPDNLPTIDFVKAPVVESFIPIDLSPLFYQLLQTSLNFYISSN